jgi:hypothetical protein
MAKLLIPVIAISKRVAVAVVVAVNATSDAVQAQEYTEEITECTDEVAENEAVTIRFSGQPSTLYKLRFIQPNGQQHGDVDSYGTLANGNSVMITFLPGTVTGYWTVQLWPNDADDDDFANGTPLDSRQFNVTESE